MKKIVILISFLSLFLSCTVYTFREYEITVSLKNAADAMDYYVPIVDENRGYVGDPLKLTKGNNFTDTMTCFGVGKQVDLHNPAEGTSLRKRLEQIKTGGTYTIEELDVNGDRIPKYTIKCTSDDVEDVTAQDDLYRRYKITLDWNKRVPIAE